MSIQVPIRLKVLQNGAVVGYVEAIDFVSGASVQKHGPTALITISGGGGGGDADTLQTHPASFFATAADVNALDVRVTADEGTLATLTIDVLALQAAIGRAQWWDTGGVVVSDVDPGAGITYAQWLAGATGDFGWLRIP
jgi:hypothetical protein